MTEAVLPFNLMPELALMLMIVPHVADERDPIVPSYYIQVGAVPLRPTLINPQQPSCMETDW